MGAGQSTELATCAAAERVRITPFAQENADELRAFMIRLNDTAEFVARRRYLDNEHRAAGQGDEKKNAGAAADKQKEDEDGGDGDAEERGMWDAFTHIHVANHYLNDDALLEPVTEGYFFNPLDATQAVGVRVPRSQSDDDEEDEDIDSRVSAREGQTTSRSFATHAVPMSALDVLSRNGALVSLDLSFNSLTARVMGPLVAALAPLHQLHTLSLAGNAIGKDGCAHLGRYLATNPALVCLSLFQCGLTDEDLVPLLQGLSNPLASPSIALERGVTSTPQPRAGGSAISSHRSTGTDAAAAGNTHLRYLNVDFNALTDLSVRRFLHLIYTDSSRRSSSGQSSSTTTDTREAVSAVQTEADKTVTCVGTGNATLAVILYESCPHDPATMRVLDPYIYMSGRRLEYACTATGYFRSGCDYRPEDLSGSRINSDITTTTTTTTRPAHGSLRQGSSGHPTVESAGTLAPPHTALPPISLSYVPNAAASAAAAAPRRGSSASTGAQEEAEGPLDGFNPPGPLNESENVYYDGAFVEEELAEVSEAQRREAARERYVLRRSMLNADFAGLRPFDPYLRRHLSVLLMKRRLVYEQELRQQRRAAMEKAVMEALADATTRRALVPVQQQTAMEARDAVQGGATTSETRSADKTSDDDEDANAHAQDKRHSRDHEEGQDENEAIWSSRSAPRCVAPTRPSQARGGQSTRSWQRLRGSLVRSPPAPLESPERLETVWRDAKAFRDSHAKPGTTTRTGLEYRVVPNGFDKVLLAASVHGGGGSTDANGLATTQTIPADRLTNKLVNDTCPQCLKACWCDPQDASLLYGGSLHYHCVREHAVLYGNPTTTTTSPGMDEDAEPVRGGGGGAVNGMSADKAHSLLRKRKLAYRGCQGTGHRCVSRGWADARKGEKASFLPPLADTRGFTAASTTRSAPSAAAGTAGMTGIINGGGANRAAKTIHTDQSGLTVSLAYNPVVFFSSAYVPSATIVNECAE